MGEPNHQQSRSLTEPISPGAAASKASAWLTARLTRTTAPRSRLFAICAAVFLTGLGVRLMYWQDAAPELSVEDTLSRNMAVQYRREARRILDEGSILYPRERVDPGDARLIIHPPGYSIVMAVSFKLFGETEAPLRGLQVVCDALAALMVFFTPELYLSVVL